MTRAAGTFALVPLVYSDPVSSFSCPFVAVLAISLTTEVGVCTKWLLLNILLIASGQFTPVRFSPSELQKALF
jgi:uncharacterized membrane protein YqaE (UPF0057 family)